MMGANLPSGLEVGFTAIGTLVDAAGRDDDGAGGMCADDVVVFY